MAVPSQVFRPPVRRMVERGGCPAAAPAARPGARLPSRIPAAVATGGGGGQRPRPAFPGLAEPF